MPLVQPVSSSGMEEHKMSQQEKGLKSMQTGMTPQERGRRGAAARWRNPEGRPAERVDPEEHGTGDDPKMEDVPPQSATRGMSPHDRGVKGIHSGMSPQERGRRGAAARWHKGGTQENPTPSEVRTRGS